MCLRLNNGVSLICRLIVIGAVKDSIIFRLPYLEFAYLASTDGKTFSK